MTDTWLEPGSHAVRFYESDTAAYDSIADFFTAGARADDPLILVARSGTFEAVAGLLASGRYGPPVPADRIQFLDVDSVLARVMETGVLDPPCCEAFLVELLTDIRRDHASGTIRLFGEAAGVLCERGRLDDAMALERVVAELSRFEPQLAIFCGYALSRFGDDAQARQYRAVCDVYAHAASAEVGPELPPQGEDPAPQISDVPPVQAVYVVDDDASIRRSLGRLLKLSGWQVRTFDSGEAFLAEMDSLPAGCLVLDMQLGGMTGLDVLAHIKARHINWPAIAMSGSDDDDVERDALRLGARIFLRKPFSSQVLLDAIAQAFAQAAD
jgi:CheY-like chemotaxis protein